MSEAGGCHCGAIRDEVSGPPDHVALCHCEDCRRSAGAPVVSFAAFPRDRFRVTEGAPVEFNSSGRSVRSLCGTCGSSLFYRNEEFLPGLTDIHTATLDHPDNLPPTAHIQIAERIGWMSAAHTLPSFERYPG